MPATDHELLAEFVQTRSESAFHAIVERNIDHAHSVAFRVTSDVGIAEDVVQGLFIKLAREAPRLPKGVPLQSWLHTKVRALAIDAVRSEEARRRRQQKYADSSIMNTAEKELWSEIEAVLDGVIDKLNSLDRQAIILKYYRGLDHAGVGKELGIGANAARVRTQRALDKLRRLLAKRGIRTTAALLAGTLPAHAVSPASVPLATAVTKSALAATVAPTTLNTIITLTMAKVQTTLIVVAGIGLVSLGVWQNATINELKEENHRLSQSAPDAGLEQKGAPSTRGSIPLEDRGSSSRRAVESAPHDLTGAKLRNGLGEVILVLASLEGHREYRHALKILALAITEDFGGSEAAWLKLAEESESDHRNKLLAKIADLGAPNSMDLENWQAGIKDGLARLRELDHGLQHAHQINALADSLDHGNSKGIEGFARASFDPKWLEHAKTDPKIAADVAKMPKVDVDAWYDDLEELVSILGETPSDMQEYDSSRKIISRLAGREDPAVAMQWIDAIQNEGIRAEAALEFVNNEHRRTAEAAAGDSFFTYPVVKMPENLTGTADQMVNHLREHGEVEATSYASQFTIKSGTGAVGAKITGSGVPNGAKITLEGGVLPGPAPVPVPTPDVPAVPKP